MKRMPLAMEWAHPNQCFQQIFFLFPSLSFLENFCTPNLSPRAHSKEMTSINTLPCEPRFPPLWNGGSTGEGWGRLGPITSWVPFNLKVLCVLIGTCDTSGSLSSKHCGNNSHYADGHRDRGLLRTRVCQAQFEELWKPYKWWFPGVLCGSYVYVVAMCM